MYQALWRVKPNPGWSYARCFGRSCFHGERKTRDLGQPPTKLAPMWDGNFCVASGWRVVCSPPRCCMLACCLVLAASLRQQSQSNFTSQHGFVTSVIIQKLCRANATADGLEVSFDLEQRKNEVLPCVRSSFGAASPS